MNRFPHKEWLVSPGSGLSVSCSLLPAATGWALGLCVSHSLRLPPSQDTWVRMAHWTCMFTMLLPSLVFVLRLKASTYKTKGIEMYNIVGGTGKLKLLQCVRKAQNQGQIQANMEVNVGLQIQECLKVCEESWSHSFPKPGRRLMFPLRR